MSSADFLPIMQSVNAQTSLVDSSIVQAYLYLKGCYIETPLQLTVLKIANVMINIALSDQMPRYTVLILV